MLVGRWIIGSEANSETCNSSGTWNDFKDSCAASEGCSPVARPWIINEAIAALRKRTIFKTLTQFGSARGRVRLSKWLNQARIGRDSSQIGRLFLLEQKCGRI